jgi:hypothetical protein
MEEWKKCNTLVGIQLPSTKLKSVTKNRRGTFNIAYTHGCLPPIK